MLLPGFSRRAAYGTDIWAVNAAKIPGTRQC
jgi:hypothetical protein